MGGIAIVYSTSVDFKDVVNCLAREHKNESRGEKEG